MRILGTTFVQLAPLLAFLGGLAPLAPLLRARLALSADCPWPSLLAAVAGSPLGLLVELAAPHACRGGEHGCSGAAALGFRVVALLGQLAALLFQTFFKVAFTR